MNSPALPLIRPAAAALALAVVVAVGLATAPAGVANAADGDANWTVRTASNALGADRTSYSYTLNAGGTVSDALVISNHGEADLELGVYAADGYTTEGGQFDLLTGDQTSVGIGAWVSGDGDHITVGPGETVEYPFTLTVPENATPGDYAGGIVTSLVEPDDTQGINVDRRLGIRMSLRVSGALAPSMSIEGLRVDWNGGLNPFAGGDTSVSFTIHNTGNTTLSAQQSLAVTGPFGRLPVATPALDATPLLLPGESWKVTAPLGEVGAAGWLTATVTLTPMLVDASGTTSPLPPVTATGFGWAVPWMLVLLVLIVAVLVVGWLLLRRRRLTRQQAREDARVQEAVAEALAAASADSASR